jgi:hypothetical protein
MTMNESQEKILKQALIGLSKASLYGNSTEDDEALYLAMKIAKEIFGDEIELDDELDISKAPVNPHG